ncbi:MULTISPECIES: RsfA family transcriptional regulator [Bacillus cereus group]|uniref:RsfA family transcriptional regulator n=1 Tax=Bacillus thuringiensis serovar kumamotoensis TaxID=132267 RepID=A0A9X6PRB0_BACUK|nr:MULTISPECIES: RsfA family transcriptional regulator [Bacillus cereus group]MCH5475209.1 RsfA family transcriptional regulator [Bacillus cereus]MCM3201676.1 RsfA family transcriptional regulator [Bacillus cereus]MDA2185605.1 RsfA family transcriptional regulator [Bacillus cereus]MDA2212336.1 RsfA family transcriptional regulator [Bacillus cereus]MDA2223916.1 RsfA family transcriptional regulator [Bacillus cereus]
MVISRQDSWTNDNDLLLASTVLQNIRNGGTQLAAFKEVAKLLNRTPAACGFRWNSYVRKQYQEEIQQAKQNREAGNNISPSQQKKETNSLSMTLDDIILFLQNYKKTYEFTNLQSQIKNLETENQSLLQRVTMYEEEYRMLLNHIDKTRSLVEIN